MPNGPATSGTRSISSATPTTRSSGRDSGLLRMFLKHPPDIPADASTRSLLRAEIFLKQLRVGWRFVLLDRHQIAVRVGEIRPAADHDQTIFLSAVVFLWFGITHPLIDARDRPRMGERMIDGGDLVVHGVGI